MISSLFTCLVRLWGWVTRTPLPYTAAYVDDFPEQLEPRIVYVVGENGYTWFAALACPCGCGATIQLSLLPSGRPRWTFLKHWTGTVTLHPSIWRNKGCRSHFFLQKGRVVWCGNIDMHAT